MAPLIAIDEAAAIPEAVRILRSGGTVVLPTDTVYGIAALPSRPDAIARIFELKQRPPGMHLAVLVADAGQVARVSGDTRPGPQGLMRAFWPGGLTIVMEEAVPEAEALGPGDGTVGVRCPDHDVVRAVCRAVGPIAATSANLHGHPTAATAGLVAAELAGADLVLDGGTCGGGVASTVVDATGSDPVILRDGPIGHESIVAAWDDVCPDRGSGETGQRKG